MSSPLRTCLLSSVVAFLSLGPATAATLRVPEDYPTVQSALAAASRCDEVQVGEGVWTGVVDVPKGVVLRGVGAPGTVVLDGDGAEEAVYLTHGSVLRDVTVRNARFGVRPHGHWSEIGFVRFEAVETAVIARNSTHWLHDVTIDAPTGPAVRIEGDAFWADDVTILDAPAGFDLSAVRGRLVRVHVAGVGTGAFVRSSTLSIRGSTFEDAGLGLFVQGPGVEIEGSTFVGNDVGAHLLDAPALVLDNDFDDNGYALRVDYGDVEIVGNRFGSSPYAAISLGFGATGGVRNNHFVGGALAIESVLADPLVVHNDFEAVDQSVHLRGGAPNVRNNLIVGGALCIDATDSPAALVGWNALDCATDALGYDVGLNHDVLDFVLDYDFVGATFGVASTLVDAADPDPLYSDLDGTRADPGRGGGPDAGRFSVEPFPSTPSLGEQFDVQSLEGDYAPLFVMNVHDDDGDPIALRWDSNPADGLLYCDDWANALEFITPDDGSFTVAVRAEDPGGAFDETTITITGLNRDPEIDAVEVLAAAGEGEDGALAVFAFDRGPQDALFVDVDHDGDGLWDVEGANPGAIPFVPRSSGTFTARIDVRDDDGAVVTTTLDLEVANLPPTFGGELPGWAQVGEAWEARLDAADPGEDTLVFTLGDVPEGLTLDDGVLRWTPIEGQEGAHRVEVTADDGEGGTAQLAGSVEVFAPPAGGEGCGCDQGSGPASALFALSALVPVLRRRRGAPDA